MGLGADPSSPCPRHRSRRRPVAGRVALDRLQARLLSAGAGALPPVPSPLPRRDRGPACGRTPRLPRRPRTARRQSRLRRRPRAAAPIGMPGRWGCRHPHPSQTRTCRIPASGSSRESFARGGVEDASRDSPVEKGTEVMVSPPSSSPVRLSVVVSWTGSRSPRSPPVFPGNGSRPVAPPFPRAGPGEPSSPRLAVL